MTMADKPTPSSLTTNRRRDLRTSSSIPPEVETATKYTVAGSVETFSSPPPSQTTPSSPFRGADDFKNPAQTWSSSKRRLMDHAFFYLSPSTQGDDNSSSCLEERPPTPIMMSDHSPQLRVPSPLLDDTPSLSSKSTSSTSSLSEAIRGPSPIAFVHTPRMVEEGHRRRSSSPALRARYAHPQPVWTEAPPVSVSATAPSTSRCRRASSLPTPTTTMSLAACEAYSENEATPEMTMRATKQLLAKDVNAMLFSPISPPLPSAKPATPTTRRLMSKSFLLRSRRRIAYAICFLVAVRVCHFVWSPGLSVEMLHLLERNTGPFAHESALAQGAASSRASVPVPTSREQNPNSADRNAIKPSSSSSSSSSSKWSPSYRKKRKDGSFPRIVHLGEASHAPSAPQDIGSSEALRSGVIWPFGRFQKRRHWTTADEVLPPVPYKLVDPSLHEAQLGRIVELDGAADWTDITQEYPTADSTDEPYAKTMEMRTFPRHEEDDECVPMSSWQTESHPSCHIFHEIDWEHILGDGTLSMLSGKGHWRHAWEYRDHVAATDGWTHPPQREVDWSKEEDLDMDGPYRGQHSVVLKTLKFEHNMEDNFFEFNRVDAVAMDQLTGSPLVMDVYGYCGMSLMVQFAGDSVTKFADHLTSRGKLRLARFVAQSVASVHSIEVTNGRGDGSNVSLVHNDINYSNLMVGGPSRLPLLGDFNIAVLQMWNTKTKKPCHFSTHFPNPQWRSPEEQVGDNGVSIKPLNEKVDVYALGNIFFRFLVGRGPWRSGKASLTAEDKNRIAHLKMYKGALPPLSEEKRKLIEEDPALRALYRAMKDCYKMDPDDRPAAIEVVRYLAAQLTKLEDGSPSPN